MQDVNYTYNERGWLLTDSAALFNEKLQYDQPGLNPARQYNGNIAAQLSGSGLAPNAGNFIYSYDKLNRLTSGVQDTSFAERNISYDQAGNIQTLSRVYAGNLVDSLNYTYTDSSLNLTNQLQQLQDVANDISDTGYQRGSYVYAYDGNGNMIQDESKWLTAQYNLLDQPAVITLSPQKLAPIPTYYYHDANGEKLGRYYLNENLGPKGEIDYSFYDNGLEVDNNRGTFTSEQNIFLQTEEGRVFPYSTDSTNYYQYYLTDHLGNTRLAFDTPNDTLKVEQQDDYLPFGMEISKLGIGNPKNEYLYNKKELQEGFQLYDYGARFYDPVIGRFTTVDPLAEISRRWSPYNYVENDPVRNTDPDGMEVTYSGDNVTYTGDDAVNFAKGQQAYAAKTAINGLHALGFSGPGDGGKGNKKRPALDGSDTKIQPITGWFWRALDYVEGGRDVNGFNYDADGNPRGVAINKMEIAPPFGPAADLQALSRLSVEEKLARYLLNMDHPIGGAKAKWFEQALGFTTENSEGLAKQLIFDAGKAVETGVTQYGTKYNQLITVIGANGRKIDVLTAWIKNNDNVVRFVTAIPTKL